VAQRKIILLEDDLDGGEADETIQFSLDGTSYEIDLSAANAAKLRESLEKYVKSGRKTSGRAAAKQRGRASTGRVAVSGNTQKIREWARESGFSISDRGRVPGNILEAYEKANA
jgi:hypothetical protein